MNISSFLIGYQAGKNAGGGSSADVRYVTFKSRDGTVEYGKKAVAYGDDCADPIARGIFATPTEESTAQFHFTHDYWATQPNGATDPNALKTVTEDRVVYATFISVLRSYTITFYDGDTVLNSKDWAYGSTPSYTPSKDGYDFVAWEPAVVPVTGEASYTATWKQKPAFAALTWAEIEEICNAGEAAKTFAVGDKKSVKIGTSYCSVVILGFDHDTLADGSGKAAISLALTSTWNKTVGISINSASRWSNSSLRTTISSILDEFPADLKTLVKPVTKTTKYTGSTTETTTDSLWPLSDTEIGLYDHGEGSVYKYYGTGYSIATNSLWKLDRAYWLRTMNAAGQNQSFIGADGKHQSGSSKTNYCHFGFCI